MRSAAGLREIEQQPAGVAIDAMHEFERFVGPRGAQRLDDAEAHAAAAVHGDAGRLVDDQQPRIFVDDGADQALHHRRRRAARRRGSAGAHRRHPHDVACQQPLIGLGALAVHAHLAFADHAKDMGLGHVLEDSAEKVVEPLACAALADFHLLDFGGRFGRRFDGFRRSLTRWRHRRFVTSCFH